MAHSTLLLNSTYEPLKVISWQRAVTLLWLQKVEVIDAYDRMLHSVSITMATPAVVRLHRYIKRRRLRVSLSRRNLFMRDKGQCQYCQKKLEFRNFTLDHVIPRSRGGHASWTNLVAACGPCNRKKGSRMPKEANMQLRMQPTEPRASSCYFIEYTRGTPAKWHKYLKPYVGADQLQLAG